MTSARERRQQAHSCVELAKSATDQFTKDALAALAEEFESEADTLDHPTGPPQLAVCVPKN
jgi:hypothetical protein